MQDLLIGIRCVMFNVYQISKLELPTQLKEGKVNGSVAVTLIDKVEAHTV